MHEECATENQPENSAASPETRTALLDAADRLLAQFGFRRISVQDIAAEAKLSRRTFYLYFADKEAITLATFDRRIAELVALLEQEAAAESSATERLRRMLTGRVLFLFDQASGRIATYDEIFESTRTAYMPRRLGYLRAESAVLSKVLLQAQSTGEFAIDNPERVAMTLLLATNALMPFSLSAEQRANRSWVEDELNRVVSLLLRGLRHPE